MVNTDTTALASATTIAMEGLRPETGEIVPLPAVERVGIAERFRGASTQPVTEEQAKILMTPCDITELDILPTGEVYLSHVGYRRRLNQVFRPGGWSLVPLDKPAMVGNTLMQPWALYVNGCFISSTYGEADYQKTNARQSYATAAESLKSNALMRCCKDLGIASECWDRRFTETFKRDYCLQLQGKWKRKDASNHEKPKPDGKVDPLVDSDINFEGRR